MWIIFTGHVKFDSGLRHFMTKNSVTSYIDENLTTKDVNAGTI